MNDQLQNQLAEIIAAIHRTASAGADFAMAQLPDIAQQYVIYGRVAYTTYTLIGLGFVLLAVLALRKAIRLHNEDAYENDGYVTALGVGTFFSSCIGAHIAASNFSSAMMVWFAPKVWLLKELAGLLK